jgi:hypothetical protein
MLRLRLLQISSRVLCAHHPTHHCALSGVRGQAGDLCQNVDRHHDLRPLRAVQCAPVRRHPSEVVALRQAARAKWSAVAPRGRRRYEERSSARAGRATGTRNESGYIAPLIHLWDIGRFESLLCSRSRAVLYIIGNTNEESWEGYCLLDLGESGAQGNEGEAERDRGTSETGCAERRDETAWHK